MASKQTEHYGLNQWVGEDAFLRSDFNQDNIRLESALCKARAGMERLGYQAYRLVLEDYYGDGLADGQRGMVFDGFRTGDRVAEHSGSLLFTGRSVRLERTGQADVTWPWKTISGVNRDDVNTSMATATGAGLLTGFEIKYNAETNNSVAQTLHLMLNGVQIQTMEYTIDSIASSKRRVVPLNEPVPLVPGDQFFFRLQGGGGNISYYLESSYRMGGVAKITPTAGTAGTLTAVTADTGPYSGALLYVRHSGGAVMPALNGETPVAEDTRVLTNGPEGACTESCWRVGPGEGPVTLSFALALGAEEARCDFYDYGLVLM